MKLLGYLFSILVIGGAFSGALYIVETLYDALYRRQVERDAQRHLAAVSGRCSNCRGRRLTMPYSDGWAGPVEPWCGPCIRDTEGVATEGAA